MKRQYRQVLPLLTAAALASFSPMQALAENPQFAHDEVPGQDFRTIPWSTMS